MTGVVRGRTAHRTGGWLARWVCAWLVGALLSPGASVLHAQSASVANGDVHAAVTSAVGRARGLLDGGEGAAARALLDSLVAHTAPGSDDLAESLYWRAVLAERTADAERDWKRMVVEAPLSPRVPDALLRLADLEILRGRPAAARAHLDRIVRDFSNAPQYPKALLVTARSYFEERDATRACQTAAQLRSLALPEGELRLQVDELTLRCTASAEPAATTTADNTAGAAAAPASEGRASRASDRARYTVQIAAYDTRAQAEAVVKRLVKRGMAARVDGTRKPYRVRVGRYETRAEATAALARLKKAGQKGFVAELDR